MTLARYYDESLLEQIGSALPYHLAASEAHAIVLGECGLVSHEVVREILIALGGIRQNGGALLPKGGHIDDLCTSIEACVTEAVGTQAAGYMHTGRSRNDYFMGIVRMQTRDGLLHLWERVIELQSVLLQRAEEHATTVFPGYTHHVQQAQPVTFGHFLLAHHDALARDVNRLRQARTVTDASPFGAAALAGSRYPIDRRRLAALLGFRDILMNTEDACGSRDFQLQVLASCAILCSSLGRLAESLILYTSHEFNLVELDDSLCGISSIMPQKKNPVALELVEVALADNVGRLTASMITLKGTTLGNSEQTSSCDTRVSEAIATCEWAVSLLTRAVETLRVKATVALDTAQSGLATATDVTDILVLEGGLSFREAHGLVGRAVQAFLATRDACDLRDPAEKRDLVRMVGAAARDVLGRDLDIDDDSLLGALSARQAVLARTVLGATAPDEIQSMLCDSRMRVTRSKADTVQAEALRAEADHRLREAVAQRLRRD